MAVLAVQACHPQYPALVFPTAAAVVVVVEAALALTATLETLAALAVQAAVVQAGTELFQLTAPEMPQVVRMVKAIQVVAAALVVPVVMTQAQALQAVVLPVSSSSPTRSPNRFNTYAAKEGYMTQLLQCTKFVPPPMPTTP
jgi:hypothetical protein